MTAAGEDTPTDEATSGENPDATGGPTAKTVVANRFADADLASNRFINVLDGEKGTRDHDTRYSDPREVPGTNYGIYSGGGHVAIDVDDYGETVDVAGLDAINSLPETLSAITPHTDGEHGGHRDYQVVTDRSAKDFDVDDVLSNYIDEDGDPTPTYEAAKDDPVALTLAVAFGTPNPQPSWGEVRAINQYVVGPGSQLDGCDKEWCDECAKPTGGRYTVATDAPIATITAEDLVAALREDPDLATGTQADDGDEVDEAGAVGSDYDPAGTPWGILVQHETDVGQYLGAGAKAAGFESNDGTGDRSRADYRVCILAVEYGVPETDVRERLAECPYSKVGAADAGPEYWRRTWAKAVREAEANTAAPEEYLEADPVVELFRDGCEAWDIDSGKVGSQPDGEDGKEVVGVGTVVGGCDKLGEAVVAFDRHANFLDGKQRQSVVGHVVFADLKANGEFFQTPTGGLYYFHTGGRDLYRIDDAGGRRVLAEEFQAFAWDRYNLLAGTFSRNLGKDLKRNARVAADERPVYRFAHYDETGGELYVTDFGDGYYAVGPDDIEWRANGTDVFFHPMDRAEAYDYLPADDRPDLPTSIPGERASWSGSGDPVMRLFGNRVNYDESAAMGPADQRKQLYLHLHTLPFIDQLEARPIMAWVGEKGSGKTVLQRSIGRFIYGGDYRESVMPDSRDDFMAKVSNQALAFFDNYDQTDTGTSWVEDVLAAVATGAAVDLRDLYTTNDLYQDVPRCWLSLTSRTPEFNRDDVADRTLVFRVERVEDGFVGEGDYLRQVTAHRDTLWSAYLDNLRSVIRTYHARDTGSMSSDHRMADWAIFAQVVADALGMADVEELLATIEAERATFALENERWAQVLGEWIADAPDAAADYRPASDLLDGLEAFANDKDLPWAIQNAAGLGSKLSTYHNELGELYGMEIDDSGDRNRYRFTGGGDDHRPVGLGQF